MHIDRDTAAIVGNRDRFVGVNRDRDKAAMTGQRFVDGVVDHLENHVVQAGAIVGIANVHARPLADGLQAF